MSKIKFLYKTHQYFNTETKEQYTSVTKLIKNYTPPFYTEQVATRIAKRDGLLVEEVLRSWDIERLKSIKRGKSYHKKIENHILGIKRIKWIEKNIEPLWAGCISVVPEKLVWSDAYKVAGTMDIKVNYHNGIKIFDTKTNKEINSFSKYGDKMLYPINHLDNCELVKYSLQIHIYAICAEELGFGVMIDSGIIHINHNSEICIMPILNLKKEAILIMDHFLNFSI